MTGLTTERRSRLGERADRAERTIIRQDERQDDLEWRLEDVERLFAELWTLLRGGKMTRSRREELDRLAARILRGQGDARELEQVA